MGCGASRAGARYALAPEPEPTEPRSEPEPGPGPGPESEPEPEPEPGPGPGPGPGPEPPLERNHHTSSFDVLEKQALLRICSWLSIRELGTIARVSRRFSEKMEWPSSTAACEVPALRSVVEQVARQWVLMRSAAEQARATAAWADGSCWLRRMHEIFQPLAFRRSHELVNLTEDGAVATKTGSGDYTFRAAASTVPMCSGGRYYAAFTILKYVSYTLLGVVQPPMFGATGRMVSGCDVQDKWVVHDIEGHMFYSTGTGRRCPGPVDSRNWEGAEGAEEGDTIGLLLDLDEGSLSVYKNDRQLGVMASGLTGVFCWAVSMGSEGDSIRIASAPIPGLETDPGPEPEPEPEPELEPQLDTALKLTDSDRAGRMDESAQNEVTLRLMAEEDRQLEPLQLSAEAAAKAQESEFAAALASMPNAQATVAHVLRSSVEEQIKYEAKRERERQRQRKEMLERTERERQRQHKQLLAQQREQELERRVIEMALELGKLSLER